MTIPTNVLDLAVKGGYDNFVYTIDAPSCVIGEKTNEQAVLSPDFWRGLGKSLGWENKETCRYGCQVILNGNGCSHDLPPRNKRILFENYHAHQLYDLILQEKPTDQFWQDIINNK